MALVKAPIESLHKMLIPGMNALLEKECEKQVRAQAEPIIKTIADEMAKRLTQTISSIVQDRDPNDMQPRINVVLKIDYKAGARE